MMPNLVKGNLEIPAFFWWVGVVESRADTEELGRYKVRIVGYHDSDVEKLPTKDLPWAIPLQPTTSAGSLGIGHTPGLVEGATVLGFFADGEDGQQPVIFGSFAGFSGDTSGRQAPSVGFRDLSGRFPPASFYADKLAGGQDIPESDISRLARGSAAEDHVSLAKKRDTRVKAVPRAVPSEVVSVDNKSDYEYNRTDPSDVEKQEGFSNDSDDRKSNYWNEPFARFNIPVGDIAYGSTNSADKFSAYPYNKVHETESGHVVEFDDTPGNERTHYYHKAGTFEEVQADGTRITKIVKDNYQITVGNDKVYIRGNADVTVEGVSRLYVLGDVIQEIEGDLHTTVKGNRITQIKGNDVLEVHGDQNQIIQGNRSSRVGKDDTLNVGRDRMEQIGQHHSTSVTEDSNLQVGGDSMIQVVNDQTAFVNGGMSTLVGGGGIREATQGSITHVANGMLTQEIRGNIKVASKEGGVAIATGDLIQESGGNIKIEAAEEGKKVTIKGETKVDINP